MSKGEGPQKVGDVLERVLAKAGITAQIEHQAVLEEWENLVGEGIARLTRARSVSAGVLVVEVRSSAWLMELDMMKRDIMARLNAGRSSRIDKLVFVLADGDGEDGAPPERGRAP